MVFPSPGTGTGSETGSATGSETVSEVTTDSEGISSGSDTDFGSESLSGSDFSSSSLGSMFAWSINVSGFAFGCVRTTVMLFRPGCGFAGASIFTVNPSGASTVKLSAYGTENVYSVCPSVRPATSLSLTRRYSGILVSGVWMTIGAAGNPPTSIGMPEVSLTVAPVTVMAVGPGFPSAWNVSMCMPCFPS